MKRNISLLAAVIVAAGLCLRPAGAVTTGAAAAVLMDAESGRVLYAHHADEPRLIASTTKLMTALVAVEHTDDLDELITIKAEWTGIEGSSVYLRANEKMSMRGLLYGLLLQSGNDAAVAIACYVAGDIPSFAMLMNERAAELGMMGSKFNNPSGLNDADHYSTAYDMALLACACLRNETVAEICAARSAVVGSRTFYNHNKMLHRYEGCVGMKTGYTELAGRTLVSAAKRDGQTLVCVTLNDRDDWNDHERLLDYGFSTFPSRKLCDTGECLGAVRVEDSLIPVVSAVAAGEVLYPMQKEEIPKLQIELAHSLCAPVSAGMPVGWACWLLDGNVVAEVELICAVGVETNVFRRETIFDRLIRNMSCCRSAPSGKHLI